MSGDLIDGGSGAGGADGIAGGSVADSGRNAAGGASPPAPTYSGPWAPSSWDRAVAERHWKSLDPELQAYISRRETEAHQRIAELGQRAKRWDPFEPLMNQYSGWFEAKRVQPAELLNHFLSLQQQYERDPANTALSLMPPQAQAHLANLQQQAQMSQRNAMLFQAALAERQRLEGEIARIHAETQAAMQKAAAEQALAAERARRNRALPTRGNVYTGPSAPTTMDATLQGVARNLFPGYRP